MLTAKSLLFTIVVQLFFAVLLLSIEIGLRQTEEYQLQFNVVVQTGPDNEFLNFNSKWATQFFSSFQPSTGFFPFPKVKSENEFRIFALGGSTTAGFPYSYHNSFPMYLREILQLAYPEKTVRVINFGQTAINSFQISELLSHLKIYKPDAVVLYAGHNEFYGAMGSGSSESALVSSSSLKRILMKANQLATVYFGKKWLGLSDGDSESKSGTTMENMVRNADIQLNSGEFISTIETFSENLERVFQQMEENKIPIYTATVFSNLSGQRPLGESDSALFYYEKGVSTLFSDSLSENVKKAFIRAKEWDPIRFRAPKAINESIRRFTKQNEFPLVDLESWSESQPDFWIHPERWFTDHLHPTDSIYLEVAQRFAKAIVRHHPDLNQRTIPKYTSPLDPIDAVFADANIQLLTNRFPFTSNTDPNLHTAFKNTLILDLSKGNYYEQQVGKMLSKNTSPARIYYDAVQEKEDSSELMLYRGLLYWQPFNSTLHSNALSAVVKKLDNPEAGLLLASDIAVIDRSIPFLNVVGALFLKSNEPSSAQPWLENGHNLDPSYKPIIYNLARTHLLLGDTLTSKTFFKKLSN